MAKAKLIRSGKRVLLAPSRLAWTFPQSLPLVSIGPRTQDFIQRSWGIGLQQYKQSSTKERAR